MLAKLLTLLADHVVALSIIAALLALAFRRNRYLLVLVVVLGLSAGGSDPVAGLRLAAGLLICLAVLLPEASLRAPRTLALLAAAATLPWWPEYLPQLIAWLQRAESSDWPLGALSGRWASLLVGIGVVAALWRWLRRGYPFELHLALALLPVLAATWPGLIGGATGWLALAAVGFAFAVLYGAYRMAFVDALTGLPNRRALDEHLARSQGRIAVAMVDVDHFKRFNDRHGHEAGDRVLRVVARELRRCPGGSAFRYGGEEFAIVFAGRQVERADQSLERVRAAIESRRVALGRGATKAQAVRRGQAGGEVSVTVSMGLAARDASRRSTEAIVDAADKALYRSKQRGRNRLTLAACRS